MLFWPTHETYLTEISPFYCAYHLFALGSNGAHRNGNYFSRGMVFERWTLPQSAVVTSYRGNFSSPGYLPNAEWDWTDWTTGDGGEHDGLSRPQASQALNNRQVRIGSMFSRLPHQVLPELASENE
jgi:hypothetical protein